MTPNPALNKLKTESELLQHKAETAKQALINTLMSLKKSASPTEQVSRWTQKYPLPSTGAALLAGFVIASPFSKSESIPPRESMDMGIQTWAVLLNTGADILKEVLTPWLQAKLQPE